MQVRENVELKNITMQGLICNPVLVVVQDKTKTSRVNIVTISYVGVLCEDFPIVGLAIRRNRYSHGLIAQAKEFTINIPTEEMLYAVDYCGSGSGKNKERVLDLGLELAKATKIKTPIIKAAPISLECKLLEVYDCTRWISKDLINIKKIHDYFVAKVVAMSRKSGYKIEAANSIVTTNYEYRRVGAKLGAAWHIKISKKGG